MNTRSDDIEIAARGEEGVGVSAQSEYGEVLGAGNISATIGEGGETRKATKEQNW